MINNNPLQQYPHTISLLTQFFPYGNLSLAVLKLVKGWCGIVGSSSSNVSGGCDQQQQQHSQQQQRPNLSLLFPLVHFWAQSIINENDDMTI